MKYRKKPVVIEAKRLAYGYGLQIALWCNGKAFACPSCDRLVVDIETLEGTMRAHEGDWIIRGVQGEFYPVKPDIFKATYEPVEA